MNGDDDLANRAVPLKFVLAGLVWLLGTFGSVMAASWWASGYKTDTDHKIASLQQSDALQSAVIGRLPDRLTRMEMILCTTEDGARKAQCDRLSVN